MTAYTCKRLCCSVIGTVRPRIGYPNLIALNGQKVNALELGQRVGLSADSIHRRIRAGRCLQVKRQPAGNKPKGLKPADARSESDRLAAWFNRLPLVAA